MLGVGPTLLKDSNGDRIYYIVGLQYAIVYLPGSLYPEYIFLLHASGFLSRVPIRVF